MASSTYLTSGIVLKRRDYREADRLVTIFTEDHGKIDTVARGVKKIVSKLAGHLEPLSYSSLMLARGRTYDILATSIRQSSFRIPQTDLRAFALASYVMETVDRLTRPNQADRQLFLLLVHYLHVLEQDILEHDGTPVFQRVLISEFFLFQILKQLGYAPELEHCVVGREPFDATAVVVSLHQGGIVCPAHRNPALDTLVISRQAIEVLRLMADGDLEPIRLMNREDATLREVGTVLMHFVRYHVGQPLNAEPFLTTLLTS